MTRLIDADDFFRTFPELAIEPYINAPTVKENFEKQKLVNNSHKLVKDLVKEWIPVSERLPDKEGHYIISTDYGDVTMDSFVDDIFVLNLGSVTAWQPLPEPYKEADNE